MTDKLTAAEKAERKVERAEVKAAAAAELERAAELEAVEAANAESRKHAVFG